MTTDQKAAYIFAQSVCAMGDILGMQAENMNRDARDETMAYDDKAFFEVCKKYGIHHEEIHKFIAGR